MAAGYALPPPPSLDIHDAQAAEKWKKFKLAWTNYSLATELNQKPEAVQVATLLTVIGEEARDVFSTFTEWHNADDNKKIEPVLAKIAQYCQPRRNVPFERYRFNRRTQESGVTFDQYYTALRKLATGCDFETITPGEILRDRLVFGIRDSKVRERLLREANLTLQKTEEICRAAESMLAQMKVVGDTVETTVSAVKVEQEHQGHPDKTMATSRPVRECGNCGRKHEQYKRELCPAYGKVCNKCLKPNHFSVKCRSRSVRAKHIRRQVQVIDEDDPDEVFSTQISAVNLDDSQLVTLKLESGNFLRFQVDTGAQCNVIPVSLYQKASGDFKGTTLPVVGSVILRVWRGNRRCKLDCKLVNKSNIRPLLGRRACVGMKIVSYLDNDQLQRPTTSHAVVYALEDRISASKEHLYKKYPNVFSEGVGRLEGEYHIRLDPRIDPVQHAPRRVPVALRDRLKETLDCMVRQGIIAPVTTPTS